MFAKLTKAACSTIASTAKLLAESDEIIVILSMKVRNSALGLIEYSMHIYQGLSATFKLLLPGVPLAVLKNVEGQKTAATKLAEELPKYFIIIMFIIISAYAAVYIKQ